MQYKSDIEKVDKLFKADLRTKKYICKMINVSPYIVKNYKAGLKTHLTVTEGYKLTKYFNIKMEDLIKVEGEIVK